MPCANRNTLAAGVSAEAIGLMAEPCGSASRVRTAANLARVRMKWCEMRFSEWQSENATKRAEMRL